MENLFSLKMVVGVSQDRENKRIIAVKPSNIRIKYCFEKSLKTDL